MKLPGVAATQTHCLAIGLKGLLITIGAKLFIAQAGPVVTAARSKLSRLRLLLRDVRLLNHPLPTPAGSVGHSSQKAGSQNRSFHDSLRRQRHSAAASATKSSGGNAHNNHAAPRSGG